MQGYKDTDWNYRLNRKLLSELHGGMFTIEN